MNRLAGREQGGAPHITVLSQRRGARRGLAGELVRRMSEHQGFSFRHVDLDSVDTGSGELWHAGGWEHHIPVITLYTVHGQDT